METAYRQRTWTWSEWHGPYQVEQSGIVDVPYQRYPRTFIPPPSIEIKMAVNAQAERVVITEPIDFVPSNHNAIRHRVNLLLELFGSVDVLTTDLDPLLAASTRRLNWELLPKGDLPWPKLRRHIEAVLRRLAPDPRTVAEYRLQQLTKHSPLFSAIGHGGFDGYIAFGFRGKDFVVLENLNHGNATYVLGQDWETVSQLSKAEVLSDHRHRDRLVHRKGWARRLNELLA